MLAKITRGNQVTIPKEVVEKARLRESSPYVDVEYANGVIYLKPVNIEERIGPEQFEKFQDWALQRGKDDVSFDSLHKGVDHFKKRMKK